jgi:hypothetical protein
MLAENRHQRVEDRADPRTGEIQKRKLPPVRQLHGDDVVSADAEPGEADSDPVCQRGELPIGESADLARVATNGG